jgi:CRISPR-associated protein Csx10
LVDAFNVYLGLPRWRDVAINAGSSVGFRLINPPDDWRERLNAVEQNGLGLRREEGFGRVVFNHPVYHRCQGITSSDITLGEGLRLAAKVTTSEHVLSKEAQFGADWKRTLDDESRWNECKDEQFAAVARWLHTNRDQPLATLCEKLKTLGEPDASLRTIIPDYGNRSKPNKINPAVDLIVSMLNKLAEKSPTKSEQALGVAMLAERIAAAIEQAKKEEQ